MAIRGEKLSQVPVPAKSTHVTILDSQGDDLERIRDLLSKIHYFAAGQRFQNSGLSPAFQINGEIGTLLEYSFEIQKFDACHTKSICPVYGLDDLRQSIIKTVRFSLHQMESISMSDIKPPRGALLWGPPGTGKTMLVKNIARDMDLNLFVIDGAELSGKYYGEREASVYRKIHIYL